MMLIDIYSSSLDSSSLDPKSNNLIPCMYFNSNIEKNNPKKILLHNEPRPKPKNTELENSFHNLVELDKL